jgi:gluconolactonase
MLGAVWIEMRVWLAAFVIGLLAPSVLAQGPGVADVLRVDAALDALVPPGTKIERVADKLQRAEGPVWMPDGFLLFSELNEIMRWAPGRAVSVYRDRIYEGGTPAGVRVGTNGLTLDRQGRLVAAQPGHRRIARYEASGTVTVLADRYMGKRLNSPNDVIVARNGDVYFTDPPFYPLFPATAKDPAFQVELEFNGVYRITPQGRLDLLVKDLGFPNGLALSPDERRLYVAVSKPKKIWNVYDVRADGTLGPARLFFDISSDTTEPEPDGLKVDARGNIYSAGPVGVWIFSPEGTHLGTLRIPDIVTNCAWGDADMKTLYVTARTGLYRIRTSIGAARP